MSETVCWCGSGKPYEDCHKEIEDEIRDPGSLQIEYRRAG